MRIVATTTVTSPYIVARYRRFAELNPQHEVILLEFGRVSNEYAWTPTDDPVPYRRVILSEKSIQSHELHERIRLISSALEDLRPDVLVVCGYGVTGMMAALRWALVSNRWLPLILLSESTEQDESRVVWKEWVKVRVVHLCSAALVGGTPHKKYMLRLGMPASVSFTGYDVVNNDFFATRAATVREEPSHWRRELGLPERYFLCSARFIPKKNLDHLLRAYSLFLEWVSPRNSGEDEVHLVLLGDGPLRPEVESTIHGLGLSNRVHLPGFRQIEELPVFYALAEAFILPSTTEQWGLVVNEAMATGLPVLVSERCGCAPDLVEHGRNGFTFDPYDVNALADLMARVASDDCDRAAMSRASREIISRWSPETFASGLERAIEAALAAPLRKAGLLDRALLWALSHR